MNVECPYCHALHWMEERLSNSSKRNPKFGKCCLSGKIWLPRLDPPPPELLHLLTGQGQREKKFRQDIRKYNDALAMTSVGRKLQNMGGGGPYVFKVHGALSHRAGSLLPAPNAPPVYAQLYIYDPEDALNYRMANQNNTGLDRGIMRDLQDMLYRHHYGVALYKSALELTRDMPPEHQCRIALHYDPGTDRRRYNLPTVTGEIAAVIPGTGQEFSNGRDIILHRREGEPLQRISEMHPFYPALHYVLLFPTAQMGWNDQIPHYVPEVAEIRQMAPGDNRTTMREYLAYRFHIRTTESNHIFRAGKLYLEYLVDGWAICEQNRLNYIRHNPQKLRMEQYSDLASAAEQNPQLDLNQVGTRIILPSSFTGSTRHMQAVCQDALAVNRHFGGIADFFWTMTANPNWPECKAACLPGQKPQDRPDIIVRVFHAKREELLRDIEKGCFGKCLGYSYSNEFQKRALPHTHSVGYLDPADKLRTPEQIDSLLSAEFPDPDTQPELFELVKKFMVHGPCGAQNPHAPCMDPDTKKCTKNYPKPFRQQTSLSEDSYAVLRRRDTGRTFEVGGKQVDNRWVVPYSPYLIWKYHCHINVEWVASIKAVKYIYKYIYKGHDRTTMEFHTCQDEVKQYLDARYVSQCEAFWRIMAYEMHKVTPNVYRLDIHLPGRQNVTWNEDSAETMNEIVEHAATKETTLTAWFKANQAHEEARNLYYQDFPTKFVFSKPKGKWTPRQRGFAVGRMYYVSPKARDSERFYLRLLLTAVRGATSFESLRTVGGQLKSTFKDACIALGLLADDNEWHQCLEEAGQMATGHQLRALFVAILIDGNPALPKHLWDTHKHRLCDDLRRTLQRRNIREDPSDEDIWDYGLFLIDRLLSQFNKSLKDWPDMPQVQQVWADAAQNVLIARERDYDMQQEAESAEQKIQLFNQDQRSAFNLINQAVQSHSGQSFFLHGPGGTGKTFVYNTLCHYLRGQGKIVVCVASSGIAALLLKGGRTAHSTFKIPIDIHESSVCHIRKNSDLADLICHTDLIIWDEAPMQHRHIHDAVDRSFRDIRNSDTLFGGISVVFGGDFQQILPVIEKGSRPEIVAACIQRSVIWRFLQILHLHQNMRLNVNIESEQEFAQWQLDVGHGKHTDELGNISLLPSLRLEENTVQALINHIYSGLSQLQPSPHQYFSDRMILSSRNDDVDDLNNLMLDAFPGDKHTFFSNDSVANNRPEDGELMYPAEYLNNINCSGFPLARLHLKIGCPVMVLRNLYPAEGVCNGSRGIVRRMSTRVIEIELLSEEYRGKRVFIPRIKHSPADSQLPFRLERFQFPLKLCFAMTINKSQGQSVSHVGLNMKIPVFTHGQFYVGVSRVRSVNNIKVIWDPNLGDGITKNVVYPEVLLD